MDRARAFGQLTHSSRWSNDSQCCSACGAGEIICLDLQEFSLRHEASEMLINAIQSGLVLGPVR
jgi:hypothetical protein